MKPIRGEKLLSYFDPFIARAAAEISAWEQKISSEEKAISEANQRREGAYAELAEFYCDEHDRLKDELVAVSRELQFQFDAKRCRREDVSADLARWEQLIDQAMLELRQARTERDAAAAQRDAAVSRVETELRTDKFFQEASVAAEAAQKQLKRERENCAALKIEVKTKLSAYEKNPFFMYLVGQAYGTKHYKATNLVRRGDEWLAKRMLWTQNHPHYLVLKALPSQGDARVEDATRASQLIEARVALRIQEVEQTHAATEAKRRLERRCRTVAEIERHIAQRAAQRDALLRERTALETNQDPFVQKAKAAIKAMLTGESLQALKARAQRTQAGRDRVLVSTIEQAEAAVNDGRLAVKRSRQKRNEAEMRKRQAEAAQRKFSSDYTGTYDYFETGLDFQNLLLGYLSGNASEGHFWNVIHHHHVDQTPAPSFSSWSFGGDSSESSSFGGGDFSGGLSSGGGDSGGSSFGGGD